MAKILLVEDDQNLSEIYNARLTAEGYDVLDAANGEDALAVAAKEKPDLIISDVMMPRVSGFEMLDILHHTDGMQGVKVIMLTALGQDNDRTKASQLGADRYLVKSQVTLEDIVTAVKELLGDSTSTDDNAPAVAAPAANNDAASQDNSASAPNLLNASPTELPAAASIPDSAPTAVMSPSPVADPATSSPVTPTAQTTATTPAGPAPTADPLASQTPGLATPTPLAANPMTTNDDDSSGNPPGPTNPVPSAPEEPNENIGQELAEAEPIKQEEAELQEQLSNDNLVSDDLPATPIETESSSTDEVPIALAPADNEATQETSVEASNTASEPAQPAADESDPGQEPVAVPQLAPTSASAVDLPAPTPVAPAGEPELGPEPEKEETPVAPSTEPASQPTPPENNHDEVLAAALKELEGDSSQSTASPAPSPVASPAPTEPSAANQISGHKVIQPPDMPNKPDINQLLANDEKSSQSDVGQASPDTKSPAPNDPNNISL